MDGTNGGSPLATSMKVGVGAVVGAGLLAAATVLKVDRQAMLILLGGVVLLALLLLVYRIFLKWLRARRSRPFAEMVKGAAGGAPNAITSPAKRAALDDLRRTFEGGISKFQSAGKDLYSLPWYLLVGEPGSGKTEAIRHCNVGFPPGLQDQLQGAGGTVNMNWWFTNHAIILDTAGRLLFQEVEPGTIGEWTEFLRLMVRNRPNCPINGLILVIPADSLIKDTADSIEAKAGKIAQQLDSIQRTLGVRFPVFVVITKCDLINGFREFFDTLSDPRLQHQILGWSNPSSLDQGFNPEDIDHHLDQVRDRLMRRRLGLLVDPVHTEDAEGQRIEQVDALYSFPDSLVKISPRLRRYLEMIFVAGEWSPKPLFLRGIYFTSSVREGTALDAELADILRVPVESLPEGRVWERDRAYFLRDLFVDKIFRERGLVTRASNTSKLQRRRKMSIIGAGFASVAALLGITWFAAHELDQSVRHHNDYWGAVAEKIDDSTAADWSVLTPVKSTRAPSATKPSGTTLAFHSRLDDRADLAPGIETVGQFYDNTPVELRDPIHVNWILKPAELMVERGTNVNEKREQAYERICATNVIAPIVQAARDKLRTETTGTWSERSTKALSQLLRLEGAKAHSAAPDMDLLFRYVLDRDDEYDSYQKRHSAQLHDSVARVAPDGAAWAAIVGSSSSTVTAGVQQFINHLNERAAGEGARMNAVRRSSQAFKPIKTADDDLDRTCAAIHAQPPTTTAAYAIAYRQWTTAWTRWLDAATQLSARLDELQKQGWDGSQPLADFFHADRDALRLEAEHGFDRLLAEVPADSESAVQQAARKSLVDAKTALAKPSPDVDALGKELAALDGSFLTAVQGADERPHRLVDVVRVAYTKANEQLAPPGSTKPIDKPKDAVVSQCGPWIGAAAARESLNSAIATARRNVAGPSGDLPVIVAAKKAVDTNGAVVLNDLALPMRWYLMLNDALATAPSDSAAVQEAVRCRQSEAHPGTNRKPKIPLTSDDPFDPRFHPASAVEVLDAGRTIDALVAPKPGMGTNVLNAPDLRSKYETRLRPALDDYAADYVKYWDILHFIDADLGAAKWSTIGDKLPRRAADVHLELEALDLAVAKALNAVNEDAPADVQKHIPQQLAALDAAREKLNRKLVSDEFAKVLFAWRKLANDPASVARQRLLALNAGEFADRFIVPAAADSKEQDFVSTYWRKVMLESLRSLIADAGDDAAAAVKTLARYDKYPLSSTSTEPLPPKQLAEADAILKKVGSVTGVAKAVVAVKAEQAIGDGGRLRDDEELNGELDHLCTLQLPPAQLARIERKRTLVDALSPAAFKSLQCAISIPAREALDKLKKVSRGKNVVLPWDRMQVVQGGKPAGVERQFSDPGALASISYPGAPLEFWFFQFAKNREPTLKQRSAAQIDQWSLLQLLQSRSSNAIRAPDNGKIWFIELLVKDNGQDLSIWLQLELETPLPKLDEWP